MTSASPLVDVQWRMVELMIDLPSAARQAVVEQIDTDAARHVVALPAFREWSGHSRETLRLYETSANQLRVGWTLGLVEPGERVVDVGCGSGSIGGRIIVGKRPARYAGIDPSSNKTAQFRGMAAENGIDAAAFELHETTAEAAATTVLRDVQPGLVLVLEMLEHVDDPTSILTAIAAEIPDECDLLISVPIVGCIEHEWGHLSVFDRSRIQQIAAAAGLLIHWVQPIAGQWLLLLLSKSSGARPRLRHLLETDEQFTHSTPESDYFFRRIDLGGDHIRLDGDSRGATLTTHDSRLVLTVDPTGHAVLRMEPGPFGVVRLRLHAPTTATPASIRVETRRGSEVVERWHPTAAELARLRNDTTWVFRRGFTHGRQHENARPGERPEALDVVVDASTDAACEVHLIAAQFLPWISNSSQPNAPRLRLGTAPGIDASGISRLRARAWLRRLARRVQAVGRAVRRRARF